MGTPQTTYALDRRGAHQPAWLDDSDLDDDPPSPEWPFDSIPGARASLESAGAPRAELPSTVARAPQRVTAAPAMAIAAAMIVTFGVGWWAGRVHPPRDQEPSVAHVVRSSAKAARREAQEAALVFAGAATPQAPAVPVPGPSPARAPAVPVASVALVASVASVASEKPTDTVARVFVPTEL
jgi:hypothetical protein